MTIVEIIITCAIIAVTTFVIRGLPFLLFDHKKEPPKYVKYLGWALPPAAFAMLVVFSLKDSVITAYPYGIPEAISLVVIVLLHLWKKQFILSVGVGLTLYLVLVNLVFVV